MELLASLFVGKPLNILVVAIPFLAGCFALRYTFLGRDRNPRPLLVTAMVWIGYAGWEWLILIRTPEANIRADLLVIWPLLAILSAWSLFRSLRQARIIVRSGWSAG